MGWGVGWRGGVGICVRAVTCLVLLLFHPAGAPLTLLLGPVDGGEEGRGVGGVGHTITSLVHVLGERSRRAWEGRGGG